MNEDWVSDLKPGDNVVVCSGGWRSYMRVETVTRTTPKQIIIKSNRYWKQNGREVGNHYGSRLEQATPELIQEIKEKIYRSKLINYLSGYNVNHWNKLSTEHLERIVKVVKG